MVGLSWLEKLGAFRGNVRVPLHAVRAAQADAEPWSALRGVRSPGTGIPGVIALGTRDPRLALIASVCTRLARSSYLCDPPDAGVAPAATPVRSPSPR